MTPDITEPYAILDTFVTGAGRIEMLGDNVRLTLCASQRGYDGVPERRAVANIVASRSDLLMIAAVVIKDCYDKPLCGLAAEDLLLAFLDSFQATRQ